MKNNACPPGSDPIWNAIKETGLLDQHPVLMLTISDSTNKVAMTLPDDRAMPGTIVIADSQTNGRGRLGRSWFSPPGTGLYFSLIIRPAMDSAELPKITLAAGVAACLAIEHETGLSPRLKWPNDLLLDGCKFGGILTETDSVATSNLPRVILGIGINVSTPIKVFPVELQLKVTSLLEYSGLHFQRGKLLSRIIRTLDEILFRLEQGDFAGILEEWKTRDATKGEITTWLTLEGKIITGVSLGPDRDGVLIIRDNTGTIHRVLSGDISISLGPVQK